MSLVALQDMEEITALVSIFWNALHPRATISSILVLKVERGQGPCITDISSSS